MPGKCLILSESTSPTQQQVWRSWSHMLKTKQSDMWYGPHRLMTEFTSCLHSELFWNKLSPRSLSLFDGFVLWSCCFLQSSCLLGNEDLLFLLQFQDLSPNRQFVNDNLILRNFVPSNLFYNQVSVLDIPNLFNFWKHIYDFKKHSCWLVKQQWHPSSYSRCGLHHG